jgi:transcriptional regulator with XRE-family HTH domain
MVRNKNKKDMTPEEIEQWLAGYPPAEESLAELKRMKLNLDQDPEFVAGFLKAMFVEDILRAMEAEGINRNELARRLGKSRQYVSRILNETDNFTIKTLAAIACALRRDIALRLLNPDERFEIVPRNRKPAAVLSASSRKRKTARAASIGKKAALARCRSRKESY